jgi:hypothetical protein
MGIFKNFKSDHNDSETLKQAGGDAFKDMNAQAAQMQEQYGGTIRAAQAMDLGAQMAIAQRLNNLVANGVAGIASVVSVHEIGPGVSGNGSVEMEFQLTQTDGPGAPRPITVRQDLMGSASAYQAGQQLQLRIDPNNPDDAMLWADAPTGSEARMAKLEQLAAMHKAGAFTDEEFAAKKAAILEEG